MLIGRRRDGRGPAALPSHRISDRVVSLRRGDFADHRLDIAPDPVALAQRPGFLLGQHWKSDFDPRQGLAQRALRTDDFRAMQIAGAGALGKARGAPGLKAFAPLDGPRPVREGAATPEDAAVDETTGDRVDLTRQGDGGAMVLLLAAQFDPSERQVVESLVGEGQRPQALIARRLREPERARGEVERLLGAAAKRRDARPHPEQVSPGRVLLLLREKRLGPH